jgi:hypothetical protein
MFCFIAPPAPANSIVQQPLYPTQIVGLERRESTQLRPPLRNTRKMLVNPDAVSALARRQEAHEAVDAVFESLRYVLRRTPRCPASTVALAAARPAPLPLPILLSGGPLGTLHWHLAPLCAAKSATCWRSDAGNKAKCLPRFVGAEKLNCGVEGVVYCVLKRGVGGMSAQIQKRKKELKEKAEALDAARAMLDEERRWYVSMTDGSGERVSGYL